MTLEEMKTLPRHEQETLAKRIKKMRKPAKTTNYSSLYGVGKKKLARTAGLTERDADLLLKAFWDINWSILEVSKLQETKVLKDGSLWVKNPISGFWHNLRDMKDIWSTLNQSTGVYVFDNWLAFVLKEGVPMVMQYHDEGLFYTKKDDTERFGLLFQRVEEALNNKLQLNVRVSSDWKTGDNYADVH